MSLAYGHSKVRPISTNLKRLATETIQLVTISLMCYPQSKSTPTCIALSPDSTSFATFSLPDRQIRIFNFLTGKLTRRYDESLSAIQEMQQAGTAIYRVDDMEFGRRLAVEREIEIPGTDGKIPGRWINVVWDESGNFILYATLLGIKGDLVFVFTLQKMLNNRNPVVNTVTNKVSRLLGKDETVRFMNLSLYQGAPAKKGLLTVVCLKAPLYLFTRLNNLCLQAMAASANPLLASKETRDPTLFCGGYKRQRFYMFTRTEPEYVEVPVFTSLLLIL